MRRVTSGRLNRQGQGWGCEWGDGTLPKAFPTSRSEVLRARTSPARLDTGNNAGEGDAVGPGTQPQSHSTGHNLAVISSHRRLRCRGRINSDNPNLKKQSDSQAGDGLRITHAG